MRRIVQAACWWWQSRRAVATEQPCGPGTSQAATCPTSPMEQPKVAPSIGHGRGVANRLPQGPQRYHVKLHLGRRPRRTLKD